LSGTKKLYVRGSYRFLDRIDEVEDMLRRENIEYTVSERTSSSGTS
jgi:hypothetical protein